MLKKLLRKFLIELFIMLTKIYFTLTQPLPEKSYPKSVENIKKLIKVQNVI